MASIGADLAELMQFGWSRLPEKLVPRIRSERHDAGEVAFLVAKSNRAQEGGKIRAKRAHNRRLVGVGIERDDQKGCRARQPRRDRLWKDARSTRRSGCDHRIGPPRMVSRFALNRDQSADFRKPSNNSVGGFVVKRPS